jgi:uncharacterized protein
MGNSLPSGAGVLLDVGMRSLLKLAGVLCLVAGPAMGEAEPVLRMGQFQTPEEARAELEEWVATYPTKEAWLERAAKIRQGILEGAGLSLMPKKTPLVPLRHSLREMDGYTVENVALETIPGMFVSGNLYLPLPEKRKNMPVALCPHGHWEGKTLIEHGRLRPDMQIRCAALARMGCAVIAWDCIGFGESWEQGWQHRYSPQVLRMQLWNSIRVLDYMLELPGVDPGRVLVTGASGGGTQTMQLAAVDSRVSLSVPCAMVSAHFYGGCVCESGLPIHVRPGHTTNNAEVAALIAPRPLLIISNGSDWTKTAPELEYPHVRKIYELFGAGDRLENVHFADGKHDYGAPSRGAMYAFVARHFSLNAEAAGEELIRVLPAEELRAFDAEHPLPERALAPGSIPEF